MNTLAIRLEAEAHRALDFILTIVLRLFMNLCRKTLGIPVVFDANS